MISAVESLYEEVFESNLPQFQRDDFLTWYGVTMDFVREQRDILQQSSQMHLIFYLIDYVLL